jgi:hypothetical protein
MPIIKSTPVTKIINGLVKKTSVTSVVIMEKYTTSGEDAVITKDIPCTLTLDNETTDHITIKSMVDTLVVSDKLIDEDYNEIELQRGSSIELRFVNDGWYIMSSDGLKNS